MTNFGVELFLRTFLDLARTPAGREAVLELSGESLAQHQANAASSGKILALESNQVIAPDYDEFTGFVFKLQANLDPKHRDRMAFIRICSGTFRKGMKVYHSRMVSNTKQMITLSSAQSLFAQDRESVTIAYPGDVIGVHNPGHFAIGDTIYTGTQHRVTYPGIPSFSPEKFVYIRSTNPAAYKKFQKVRLTRPALLLSFLHFSLIAIHEFCSFLL